MSIPTNHVIPNRFSGEEPAFLRELRATSANSAVKIFNLPSGAPCRICEQQTPPRLTGLRTRAINCATLRERNVP